MCVCHFVLHKRAFLDATASCHTWMAPQGFVDCVNMESHLV